MMPTYLDAMTLEKAPWFFLASDRPLFLDLVTVNLADNQISADIVKYIGTRYLNPDLAYIDIRNNEFSGVMDNLFFKSMKNLQYLDAYGNKINEVVIDSPLPELKYLNLGGQELLFKVLWEHQTKILDLVYLNLSGAKIFNRRWLGKHVSADSLDISVDPNLEKQASSNAVIFTSSSFVDLRGWAGEELKLDESANYDLQWRTDCRGYQRCESTDNMPLGGCPHYRRLGELVRHLKPEINSEILVNLKQYERFCGPTFGGAL